MKVAIVHDELMRKGGAEQVVLAMLKAFPQADIYTLAYNSEGTYPEFKKYKINTSKFQILAKNVNMMLKLYFPWAIWAMKSMHIKGYDVVLISNTHCGKYVKIDQSSLVFMYTYTPFRLAWNPESYTQYNNSTGIFRKVFDFVIGYLRKTDAEAAKRGNFFLAMTEETAQRIKDAYHVKDIEIIKPDVKTNNFYVSNNQTKDYYLLVSRLEYYKKVDLAIQAFNELGLKLIVVGDGSKANELKTLANANIEFKKGLSSNELADMYANCKAFIFPQHEDYGITPLEANASGRPVIAYGKGGVLDTMIPYVDDSSKSTAYFFYDQTKSALVNAVLDVEKLTFDSKFIRKHAEKFDEKVFVEEFKTFVEAKYAESKNAHLASVNLDMPILAYTQKH